MKSPLIINENSTTDTSHDCNTTRHPGYNGNTKFTCTEMKKVYIIFGVDYRDAQIVGAFKSLKKAEEAKNIMENKIENYFFTIHEEQLDPKKIDWSTGTDNIIISLENL